MSKYTLDFEEPIKLLEEKILNIENSPIKNNSDLNDSLTSLRFQLENKKKEIYDNLTRWQQIQIARHPLRPHSSDYIKNLCSNWIELHGDRKYSDDPSILTGLSKIDNIRCVIIGQEKGRSTKDKMYRNFGMVKPEGYRKALRVMKIAEKFKLPIITFIDTPGAYPGIGAEERGQGEAIASNLIQMASLKVPIIGVVIGEGASGGALGIGLCDRMLMMKNTWYSVISPEGCASILYRDAARAEDAAEALKPIPDDLIKIGICDKIIEEPDGGAHRNFKASADLLQNALIQALDELSNTDPESFLENRILKYDKLGIYQEES